MSGREERLARNETHAREINDAIRQSLEPRAGSQPVRILCECGNEACERLVAITLDEYRSLRATPHHFAVAKGHVIDSIEFPVSENERFLVVQKRAGTPADAAGRNDPHT